MANISFMDMDLDKASSALPVRELFFVVVFLLSCCMLWLRDVAKNDFLIAAGRWVLAFSKPSARQHAPACAKSMRIVS